MPQITLNAPGKKLYFLKKALTAFGVDKMKNLIPESAANFPRLIKDSANKAFKKYFSWDNNRNELEFE